MFSRLKKSKSIRSLLAAFSLAGVGMPVMAEAAPKAPQKMTQSTQNVWDTLAREYMPLCEQLEGNLPYCYLDKGVIATGCGVRFKGQESLKNLKVVRLTLKKGKFFDFEKKQYLKKMADADWKSPKTLSLFPEVESANIITLKDCSTTAPAGNAKKWDKDLVVVPSSTLALINRKAIDLHIKRAGEIHPNLWRLPPSARLVIVDLIYNLGDEKYLRTFPKFQKAVRAGNLVSMKAECHTKNARRDIVRDCLMDSATLSKENPRISKEKLLQEIRKPVVKNCPKLNPNLEKNLWSVLDGCAANSFNWYQQQKYTKTITLNKNSLKK